MEKPALNPNHIAIANACAIGLVAGLAAVTLTQGVDFIGSWRLALANKFGAWIVLPAFGGIGGLVAGLLTMRFPNAAGSGIPQVKASLIGGKPQGLDIRTAAAKLIGGLIAIGSGLLMGREGPTVHVGAALSTELNARAHSGASKERLLVAAGAGAGLAAAFNAPLAGVFFVMEELLKDISSSTISTAVLACFVASVTSHYFYGDESARHIAAATKGTSFSAMEIPAYLMLGVIAGVMGALFNKCTMMCLQFNKDKFKAPLAVRICVAGIISGLLVASLPEHFHNYAGMREHVVYGDLSLVKAAMAFVVFFILTVVAYGSGAPGGLFAPALAMGSCIGHVMGLLQKFIQPDVALDTFALVGMGAMFTSVAHVPVTAIIIVFEMTQNFNIVLPLMLGCVVANAVADKFYPGSIYDRLVEWSNLLGDLKADSTANSDSVAGSFDGGTSVIPDPESSEIVTAKPLSSDIAPNAAETTDAVDTAGANDVSDAADAH